MSSALEHAVSSLGRDALSEAALREHVFPLFKRVLQRSEIYLANHSLGRPLDQTARDVSLALDAWYERMDEAWEPWLKAIEAFRMNVAELIHAPRFDCIVPKTSAGQGLRAILNTFDERGKVVTTAGEFDSIDFILKAYAERGRIDLVTVAADERGEFHVEDVLAAVKQDAVFVVLSMVMFETAQIVGELERLVRTVHSRGGTVLLDLYHAAGALPVDIQTLDADFAVGGSYKYLRGGPGACWLYVHPRHLDGTLRTLDTGWFAKPQPFSFQRAATAELASGGNAFLESTPPVLAFVQARAGLEFTLSVGVDRLRAYSLNRQAILMQALAREGVEAIGARPDRGAFVVVVHPDAARLARALRAQGVLADGRSSYLRLGPDLLNTEEELVQAARQLGKLV
ncbi:MAG: class V aminotransferase [Betaproteobacteria bacterium RIFCSPLOWO2_12_FULL_66_14]|nr:MAG: class V aminotransferase [Betaproteobacteria bacterium RIFCSPLOWO2_12_FULL_66_14]